MDRRVYPETKLRSPFLPWSDQVTPLILRSWRASPGFIQGCLFRFLNSVPVHEFKNGSWEKCAETRSRIVTSAVTMCQFHRRQKLAMFCYLPRHLLLSTSISIMRETRDDVHVDCPSGGHTTEIIRLMESLSAVYTPRHYVIADTDRMGEDKVCTFEASRQSSKSQVHTYALFLANWCPTRSYIFIAKIHLKMQKK